MSAITVRVALPEDQAGADEAWASAMEATSERVRVCMTSIGAEQGQWAVNRNGRLFPKGAARVYLKA